MTDLINQMTEIEKTAGTIIAKAADKKEQIFSEAEDKKKAFNEELSSDVEKRLLYLKDSLYLKKDQDMNDLKTDTKNAIREIQKIYDSRHTELAEQIMSRIVGA